MNNHSVFALEQSTVKIIQVLFPFNENKCFALSYYYIILLKIF